MTRQSQSKPSGSILLMVLVLTGMVVVFLISGVLLSGRQFNATVEQEEEERAFHAAEAGVHYVLYLLNSQLSGEDEFSLLAAGTWPQQTVYVQDTGDVLGSYDLTFEALSADNPGTGMRVYALGQDARSKKCQLLEAEIRRVSSQQAAYGVTKWDHQASCTFTTSASPSPSSSE